MKSNIEIGSVIKSIAGRDCEEYFIVTKVEGDYLTLVDGRIRPMGNQKLKKAKHITTTGIMLTDIATRINSKSKITDTEINNAIKKVLSVRR